MKAKSLTCLKSTEQKQLTWALLVLNKNKSLDYIPAHVTYAWVGRVSFYREMTTPWLLFNPCIFFSATSPYQSSFSPHEKLLGKPSSLVEEVYGADFK